MHGKKPSISYPRNPIEMFLKWPCSGIRMVIILNDGLGIPQYSKGPSSAVMSRGLDGEHWLVYKVYDERFHIISSRFHYDG